MNMRDVGKGGIEDDSKISGFGSIEEFTELRNREGETELWEREGNGESKQFCNT